MDRRTVFKTLFGTAMLATGGMLLAPREAEAMPRGAAGLMDEMRRAAPAVATESDLAEAEVEQVQGRMCWRNRWGEVVCRPRRRRVIVRPDGVVIRPGGPRRRCWINRRGERVCRW